MYSLVERDTIVKHMSYHHLRYENMRQPPDSLLATGPYVLIREAAELYEFPENTTLIISNTSMQ
jgi:hypothetical protein